MTNRGGADHYPEQRIVTLRQKSKCPAVETGHLGATLKWPALDTFGGRERRRAALDGVQTVAPVMTPVK